MLLWQTIGYHLHQPSSIDKAETADTPGSERLTTWIAKDSNGGDNPNKPRRCKSGIFCSI